MGVITDDQTDLSTVNHEVDGDWEFAGKAGYKTHPVTFEPTSFADAEYVDSHPGTNVTAVINSSNPESPNYFPGMTINSDGQTAFTISEAPVSESAFSLFLHGVWLPRGIGFNQSGTTLTYLDPYGIPLKAPTEEIEGDELVASYNFIGGGSQHSQIRLIHPPITIPTYNINLSTDAYKTFTNRGSVIDNNIVLPTPTSADVGKWIIPEYYGDGTHKLILSTLDPNMINFNGIAKASMYAIEYSARLYLLVMDDLKWYIDYMNGNWIF